MDNSQVTFSIPSYNDAESLRTLLEEIQSFHSDSPVLVIDDGSTDDTVEVAREFAANNSNIQIVEHEKNQGFGFTFKEAFQLPQTQWVFFLTGDNQFPAENLFLMQKKMEEFDIIVGRRATRMDNWKRRFNSMIYNRFTSILAGRKITDTNSIMLFKRMVVSDLELNSESAFINAEFLLKALKSGYSLIETDIIHKKRLHGEGSGGRIDVITPVIKDAFRYIFGRL